MVAQEAYKKQQEELGVKPKGKGGGRKPKKIKSKDDELIDD